MPKRELKLPDRNPNRRTPKVKLKLDMKNEKLKTKKLRHHGKNCIIQKMKIHALSSTNSTNFILGG